MFRAPDTSLHEEVVTPECHFLHLNIEGNSEKNKADKASKKKASVTKERRNSPSVQKPDIRRATDKKYVRVVDSCENRAQELMQHCAEFHRSLNARGEHTLFGRICPNIVIGPVEEWSIFRVGQTGVSTYTQRAFG